MTDTIKKAQAERRKILFKKYKGWFRSTYEKAEFIEPICFLMRRGKKTEFYENIKAGEWEITHSDGNKRVIFLHPQYTRTFEYGKDTFQGYITHEDFPTPLPEDPVLTTELVGIALEKTLNDIKKWKAQELKAQGELYWKILIGIAIIGVVYVLYRMLVPQAPKLPAGTVADVAKNVTGVIQRNVTIIG